MLLYEESNTVVCNYCGIVMVLEEPFEDEKEPDADSEVSASFVPCPHCRTVNEIQAAGGEEWCSACGLDPSCTDYPPERLAHLWKQGSGIQKAMKKGIPKAVEGRMYRFLTNLCGPHCSLAQNCPQDTGNYVKCFHEEVIESNDHDLLHVEGGEMGKGKKKRRRRAERKRDQERIRRKRERAVLVCAGSGWYDKRYSNETNDPQESENTRSGSGT